MFTKKETCIVSISQPYQTQNTDPKHTQSAVLKANVHYPFKRDNLFFSPHKSSKFTQRASKIRSFTKKHDVT